MHDNNPEVRSSFFLPIPPILTPQINQTLEREKHRNLSGTQKHRYDNAPGWNEHLASESEATVKSMRSESESTSTTSPEELQKQTVDHLKASDLQNSEDSSIMAPLGEVIDQVTGPLKSALGKDGKDSK
jgi:hypothetical protein